MRRGVYRWFEAHVWAGDAIPAVLLLIVLSVNARAFLYAQPDAVPLLLLSALPLFFRRTFTQFALLLGVVLLSLNLWVIGEATFAVVLAPIMVHAAVVYAGPKVWGRVALTCGLIGAVLAPIRWGYRNSEGSVLALAIGLCAVSVVAAFVIGERQRDRAEFQAEQLRSYAERAALLAAERDQRATMAAATERTRIARELHDIVAHSLSVVIVQADGAAAASVARPEVARAALQTISGTSREALAEMRRLVGVLRSTPDREPIGEATYAPAQGIRDLASLLEQVRGAGVEVDLTVAGARRALPAGMDLTLYRVVQESLTNVLKHAGPSAKALVCIDYRPTEVRVTVTDDGRGAAAGNGDGHGLLGMRERVWLQGGALGVGPEPGGGFGVRAVLPTMAPEGAAR